VSFEDRCVQVGDQFVQLLVCARRGQGEVQHVVARVDALDFRHSGMPVLRNTGMR